ncbi:hypothetical protein [Reinekea sp. G2M2-21]|uniref:hypothetical protein n=1 Tax=Reinekea sp. G2M2-21 TaxID=2788942 RepID=UPI0018ABEC1B|nr:hypothetical protein [Reinekea sp. G2M2-21]
MATLNDRNVCSSSNNWQKFSSAFVSILTTSPLVKAGSKELPEWYLLKLTWLIFSASALYSSKVLLGDIRRQGPDRSDDSGSALNNPSRRHKRLITLLNFVFDRSFATAFAGRLTCSSIHA